VRGHARAPSGGRLVGGRRRYHEDHGTPPRYREIADDLMALLRGGSLVSPPTSSAISRPARRSVAGTDKRRSLRLAVGRGRGGTDAHSNASAPA
jgi:hypothetical protein